MTEKLAPWHERRFLESPGYIKVACAVCSRFMWLPPSKVSMYKTCGGACAEQARQTAKQARERVCATCQKIFYPRHGQIRQGHGVFCSQRCNTKGRLAMSAPEAQRRARESWKKTAKEKPFHLRGPENPRWKGGKEMSRARYRPRGKEITKKYAQKYPERMRAYAHNRRVREGARVSGKCILELYTAQGGRCPVCRCRLVKYHVDHIQPLARGGGNDKANLQLLCPPCNLAKSAKDPLEFMQSKGFLL